MAEEKTEGTKGEGSNPPSGGTQAGASSIPEPKILEEIIIPREKKAAPVPPVPSKPPQPASLPQPQTPQAQKIPSPHPELKDDIANILKEVKLPARRSLGAGGPESRTAPVQKEIEKIDTTLGTMTDEKAPEARVPDRVSPPPPPAPLPPPPPPIPPISSAPILTDTSTSVPTSASTEKKSVVPVHTLKDDLRHVVREQKISVVRAASLEQDRKARVAEDVPETPGQTQRSNPTIGILFSTFLLLLLGGAALGGVYLIARERAGGAPAQNIPSLIFAESTVGLTIGTQPPSDVKRLLANARSVSRGTLGSITHIVPILSAENGGTRSATFSEFMKAIGSGAPDDLLRAAGSDFFFGIHTVDENAPLIVVPIISYDHAFAAMLAWEPTMNTGLAPIFTPLPAQTTDPNGLPTLRTFEDIVMRNYDVRALKDDAGNVQLYYSFPTREFLIIAESPFSFAEVLSRLQAERKL